MERERPVLAGMARHQHPRLFRVWITAFARVGKTPLILNFAQERLVKLDVSRASLVEYLGT